MLGRVPVLILLYNGWDDLIGLAPRLIAEGLDVWVIDNKSPIDRSAELLRAVPEVNYLPLENNWGWAGGYNRGIAHVQGKTGAEYVYILNSDGIPNPGAIESAVNRLSQTPNAAAMGSVMLTHGGEEVFFDGKFRYEPRLASDVPLDLIETNRIHGGGFALNLKAFDRVGPFYEPFFLYHEESEWCARAVKAGLKFYVDGSSRVLHEGRGSDVNSNTEYYLTRNRYLARRLGYPLDDASRRLDTLVWADLIASRDRGAREAILDGVIDGLTARWGKRPDKPRPRIVRQAAEVGLRGWVFIARRL